MCKMCSAESSKAIVLLSGGIDSSTLMGLATTLHGKENVIALTLSYGQRHAKEILAASNVAKWYNVKHIVEDLSSVFKFDKSSALLEGSENAIPQSSYAEQLGEMGGEGTVETYVPFRNGLFLSYAAAVALQFDATRIYYGAHSDDAAGNAYPDCTDNFIKAIGEAIFFGSGNKLDLCAPFRNETKKEIVNRGLKLHVPYNLTWSCYEGKAKPCGVCGTCIDRIEAFKLNNVIDPLEY